MFCFVWFLIILFDILYSFTLHYYTATKNITIFIVIAIVTIECTMLYYENTVLRLVWFSLIFIELIIKFISIYPASSHIDEQKHHSTSLTSYNLATTECQNCIRGQTIVVRDIVTLILFVCFSHLRQFTTVTNQC